MFCFVSAFFFFFFYVAHALRYFSLQIISKVYGTVSFFSFQRSGLAPTYYLF